MKANTPEAKDQERRRRLTAWVVAVGAVVVFALAWWMGRPNRSILQSGADHGRAHGGGDSWSASSTAARRRARRASAKTKTAEEIVAARLKLFSQKQRALVHRLAEHYKLPVPEEVDRFFDALDAGNWDEAQRLFKLMSGDYASAPKDESLQKFWRPIQEADGAAEQAHLWPAQQFLDYGNGILNSLRPGMAYVGGTDAGCFICTMLNATSDGEQHITLTQNALADDSYLEYLRASLDGNLNIPTKADSQAAFQQYLDDAKQRLEHDQQHPDEPRQVLPGENITLADGKVNVSGAVAVMGINNILMQDLLRLNPAMSFGMEESFPLANTYPGSAPLGPIFEINAAAGNNASAGNDGSASQTAFTSDQAAQAVSYWQNVAQRLQADPEAAGSTTTLAAYAHDAAAQGNLLAHDGYAQQAEQAYQTGLEISPDSLDALAGLTKLLAQQGRTDEAAQVLNAFAEANPNRSTQVQTLRQVYLGPGK